MKKLLLPVALMLLLSTTNHTVEKGNSTTRKVFFLRSCMLPKKGKEEQAKALLLEFMQEKRSSPHNVSIDFNTDSTITLPPGFTEEEQKRILIVDEKWRSDKDLYVFLLNSKFAMNGDEGREKFRKIFDGELALNHEMVDENLES